MRAVPTRCLLSKLTGNFAHIAVPVGRQIPTRDVGFEAAVRPIADAPDESVLHRIVVDLVNVPHEIGFITNRMFRISTLP